MGNRIQASSGKLYSFFTFYLRWISDLPRRMRADKEEKRRNKDERVFTELHSGLTKQFGHHKAVRSM